MHKRTLIVTGLALLISPSLYAEGTAHVPPAADVVSSQGGQPPVNASPMEGHVVDLMEKDFTFESQYRELSNEVVLEKLRSELRKLRAESPQGRAAAPTELVNEDSGLEEADSTGDAPDDMPALRPLLISDIAGQRRVAISLGGSAVKMVPLNQPFTVGGKRYIARPKADSVTIEALSQ